MPSALSGAGPGGALTGAFALVHGHWPTVIAVVFISFVVLTDAYSNSPSTWIEIFLFFFFFFFLFFVPRADLLVASALWIG